MCGSVLGLTVLFRLLLFLRRLVNDGAVLETSQVKHSDTAICSTRDEDIDAVGAEPYIIHFLVVRDQLGLCRQGRDIPNGTCRVNRGCNDKRGLDDVPI